MSANKLKETVEPGVADLMHKARLSYGYEPKSV
jgi:hypothetical protein